MKFPSVSGDHPMNDIVRRESGVGRVIITDKTIDDFRDAAVVSSRDCATVSEKCDACHERASETENNLPRISLWQINAGGRLARSHRWAFLTIHNPQERRLLKRVLVTLPFALAAWEECGGNVVCLVLVKPSLREELRAHIAETYDIGFSSVSLSSSCCAFNDDDYQQTSAAEIDEFGQTPRNAQSDGNDK